MDDRFILKELVKKGIIREEDIQDILEDKLENEDIFVTLVRKNILSEKQVIHLFKEIVGRQPEPGRLTRKEEEEEGEDVDFIVEEGVIKYFKKNSYFLIPIRSINFIEVKDNGTLILHFPGIDRLIIRFKNKQDMTYMLDKIKQYLSSEDAPRYSRHYR
jgi:hypothetical protein